ncbi:ATP-binding protein [Streptomyces sp. NPDC059982]|uniref:sensor histidine kinase n=2 Tax=unclassified Streptomyces TaxID=2593676 RepID=UPI0036B57DCF
MSGGSGLQRAQRFMVLATGLYRASHLSAGTVAVARHSAGTPAAWGILATALAVSLALYGTARRRGWFGRGWVWCDVLVTGCLLPWSALWALGGPAVSQSGWLMLLGGSASAAAAAGLGVRGAAASVALLLVTSVALYLLVAGSGSGSGSGSAELVGHLNAVFSSAAMAWTFWWYLRRQGALLDAAQRRAVTAEAERARQAERAAHHAALHDTVLATLTAIAAGRVDANAAPVRERCAREAAYLRRLVRQEADDAAHRPGGPAPGATAMGAALEEAVRSAESLGLKVSAQYHALPAVPREVADALAAAVGEALNNVRAHAGTGAAFLTAIGTGGGGLVVTVVDRGAGFDPGRAAEAAGTGLRRSVHARTAGIGAAAEVESVPGEGTRVALRWPA